MSERYGWMIRSASPSVAASALSSSSRRTPREPLPARGLAIRAQSISASPAAHGSRAPCAFAATGGCALQHLLDALPVRLGVARRRREKHPVATKIVRRLRLAIDPDHAQPGPESLDGIEDVSADQTADAEDEEDGHSEIECGRCCYL